MEINIPVSVGELVDKITILEIKSMFTDDEYVIKELKELNKIFSTISQDISDYKNKLKIINKKLWNIEDELRILEKKKVFDSMFIELARSVYINNDERARIKKEINKITNSSFIEIKLY